MRYAAILLLLTVGCTPTPTDCQRALPITGVPATLVPDASPPRCACITDGVLVEATLARTGLVWKRDALFIDGTPVADLEFSARLEEAKKQRREAEARARLAASARAVKSTITDTATRAADAIRKRLRR